jgi:hypothetical protein
MKLTQRRLAVVAGISLPTVVKFEAGEDVRLSSALAILKVLEMVAEPMEGLLRLAIAPNGTAAGPFQASFAPYGGSDGGLEPYTLPDRAALDGFFNGLGIEKEKQRQAAATLADRYAADIGGVRISPSQLRRYWPDQFAGAPR